SRSTLSTDRSSWSISASTAAVVFSTTFASARYCAASRVSSAATRRAMAVLPSRQSGAQHHAVTACPGDVLRHGLGDPRRLAHVLDDLPRPGRLLVPAL